VPFDFLRRILLRNGDAHYCFFHQSDLTLENMGLKSGIDFFVTGMHNLGYCFPFALIIVKRSTI
jgi:hypothetical protein